MSFWHIHTFEADSPVRVLVREWPAEIWLSEEMQTFEAYRDRYDQATGVLFVNCDNGWGRYLASPVYRAVGRWIDTPSGNLRPAGGAIERRFDLDCSEILWPADAKPPCRE